MPSTGREAARITVLMTKTMRREIERGARREGRSLSAHTQRVIDAGLRALRSKAG